MDKSNSIGQLRFRLFAEIERNLILERSAAAHARERLVGRLEKFTEKNMASLKTLVDSGMPIKNIENSWGVSRTTIYKYIKKYYKSFLYYSNGELWKLKIILNRISIDKLIKLSKTTNYYGE